MMFNSNNQNSGAKTKSYWVPAAIMLTMIVVGVSSRFFLVDSPNFKPVCALALFAGFYFRQIWMAVAVIGVTLIVSDTIIGGYDTSVMLAVYASTAIAAALGVMIYRWQGSRKVDASLFGKFAVASLSMSVSFFVLTNFAVWAAGWYPKTAAGLADCYYAAIPFFRWTLISDFVFSQAIVSVFAIATSLATRSVPKQAEQL